MAEAAAKKLPELKKGAVAVAEAKAPQKDKLGIVVFSLVFLNLLGVAGMGYFMQKMWARLEALSVTTARLATPAADDASDESDEKPVGKELEAQNLGILYPIESFLVNISSDQGPKFLQTQLEFELSEPSLEDEVARKKAAIRDAIIVLLSSKTYKELREPTGMKVLRQDLLRAVNGLLTTGRVKEIYFTQFHFN